jgi:DNA-binding winged helix-turn-helix (wHTH) protein
LDGREVALPPNEFRLLLTLAEAPGEAASAAELIEAVWGPHSVMSSKDLYWIVWKLRGRIGDEHRPKKVVANRKGHGYLIDLSVADLVVVDVVGTDLIAPVTQDPPPGADEHDPAGPETLGEGVGSFAGSLASEDGTISPASQVLGGASRVPTAEEDAATRRRLLLAACLVAVACAAGFTARSLVTDPPAPPKQPGFAQAEPSPNASSSPDKRDRQREPQPASTRKKPGGRSGRTPSRGGGAPAVAAPLPATAPPSGSSGPVGGGQPGPKTNPARKPAAPDLPPPPTRYLYHLYNPENGDHLVTTDGGVVTEHEAKGYEGGAIGRVYVAQEKDTFAIPTNFGTAYVFAHASPKTDPASPVVALWLAQKDGDFFYTTRKSEASKDGWSASPSGYVRAL